MKRLWRKPEELQLNILLIGGFVFLMWALFPYLYSAFQVCPSPEIFALYNEYSSGASAFLLGDSPISSLFVCLGLVMFRGHGVIVIHVLSFVAILIYTFSVAYIILQFFPAIGAKRRVVLALLTVAAMLSILFYNRPAVCDIFYNMVMFGNNTLPYIFAFMALALLCRERNVVVAFLCIFMTLGSGCTINTFTMGMLMVLLLFRFPELEKRTVIVASLAMLLCLCSSFFSGIYCQHSEWGKLAITTFQQIYIQIINGVSNELIMILLIVLFCVSFALGKEGIILRGNPILLGIVVALFQILVVFSSLVDISNGKNHNCVLFLRDNSLLFLLIYFDTALAGWIAQRVKFTMSLEINIITVLLIMAIISPLFSKDIRRTIFPFEIYNDIFSGELKRYEGANNLILNTLEGGNDVVQLEIWDYAFLDYLTNMDLSSDSNYITNREVAQYYDLSSVGLIYE